MSERTKGKHLSPAEKAAIVRLYTKEKQSLREAASRMGVSYGAAHRVIKEAGIPMRPRGGSH